MLHPIFLLPFILLLFLLLWEDSLKPKQTRYILLFVFFILFIAAGGRNNVGADFPIYKSMYNGGFTLYTTYQDIWKKATFQPNSMEIEWLYVLINRILYEAGFPFYTLTFLVAGLILFLTYKIMEKYSDYPSFSFLYFFMPVYFIITCGHMRQGLGGAIVVYSIHYIFQRKLGKFLFMMFLALGFHKSTIIFLPAYWLVRLPFNIKHWIILLIISIALAPFQVYRIFGDAFASITPQDVSNAYTGYNVDKTYGNEMKTGFADIMNVILIIILLLYNKIGEKKVYYYEYFRNLAFFGICLFYILRGNQIFATRLPGVYIGMGFSFIIPGIIANSSLNIKRQLKLFFFLFFIFFYFLFVRSNGKKLNFTYDRYNNILWEWLS
ncbi:EpsG family protein [Chryseobacterium sp. IT-36CA2]|uniref:EpsG family protein n=1 Tax=Chryseobacterium sp. IT-36CA2 TaxID=3026460 RepID=UPI0039E0DACD